MIFYLLHVVAGFRGYLRMEEVEDCACSSIPPPGTWCQWCLSSVMMCAQLQIRGQLTTVGKNNHGQFCTGWQYHCPTKKYRQMSPLTFSPGYHPYFVPMCIRGWAPEPETDERRREMSWVQWRSRSRRVGIRDLWSTLHTMPFLQTMDFQKRFGTN